MKRTFEKITADIRNAICDTIAYDFKKQKAFAKAVGVSPTSVGKWIKIERCGSIETILFYGKVLPLIEKHLKNPKSINIPKEINHECLKLCEGFGEYDIAMMKLYRQLDKDGRKAIREAVEDQHTFQVTGRRVAKINRNKKVV